jgi:hypothetical protein
MQLGDDSLGSIGPNCPKNLTLMNSARKFKGRLNRPEAERRPEKISDEMARISAPMFPHTKKLEPSFCWEFVLQNVSIRDRGGKKNKIAKVRQTVNLSSDWPMATPAGASLVDNESTD